MTMKLEAGQRSGSLRLVHPLELHFSVGHASPLMSLSTVDGDGQILLVALPQRGAR